MESSKKVVICGKEYEMKSSMLTQANFKNIFGMEEDFTKTYFHICEEIKKVKQLRPKKLEQKEIDKLTEIEKSERQLANLKSMEKLYQIIPDVLKLAYVMIYEADPYFMPYKEWLSTLEGIMEEPNWLYEVVGIASYVFHRQFQNKDNN